MPEEYRKQTLGYLAREEPRTVLALPEDFTGAQLKAAYHTSARSAAKCRKSMERFSAM